MTLLETLLADNLEILIQERPLTARLWVASYMVALVELSVGQHKAAMQALVN